MRKLILLLFLSSTITSAQIPQDKLYHTFGGVAIAEACYIPYYKGKMDFKMATRLSIISAGIASIIKESYDMVSGGVTSMEDVAYNYIGCAATIGVNYIIHKIRKKKQKKHQKQSEVKLHATY